MFQASLIVVCAGQLRWKRVSGARRRWCPVAGSPVSGHFRDHGRKSFPAGTGGGGDGEVFGDGEAGPEDGSEAPLDRGAAAALAAPAEQFAGLAAWAAEESRYLDHGEREKAIGQEGRELQRRLLQATFDIDSAREERAEGVTSAAGIGHGTVEPGTAGA